MFPTADTEDILQGTSLNREHGVSSNEQELQEQSSTNCQAVKQSTHRELTLKMLIKEMLLCIALALATYGALHNTPTKVSKVPQALRFFSTDSIVKDWYRGQLTKAIADVNKADVAFVMYYAPWDAESQFIREEFEKAANILAGRVYFSAINCWNPGSECRLQHNKIPIWPILMVYSVTSRGILYKGPGNAQSMVKFLELVMKPLERISSTEDLVNLLSICDAVAVGYTPLTESSRYYNVWYNVALMSREFDVMGEICFAVVTSADLSSELGVETVPNARIMLWNDTKEYKMENNLRSWNETSLMQWVLSNFIQPVARIIPMWKKAYSFEGYADRGNPMLIFFSPLNPLYEQLPNYALMREVAMEYYNCKKNDTNNQWTPELIKLQQVQRLLFQQKDFMKFCNEYKFKKAVIKPVVQHKKEVVSHNYKYPWNNMTQKNQKTVKTFNFLLKQGWALSKIIESAKENSLSWSFGLLDECNTMSLPAEKSFYENYETCQSYEENHYLEKETKEDNGNIETTMLPFEDDPLSPENLIQDNVKHFCKLMKFASELGPPVAPARVTNGNVTHIQGLACETNSTLTMIAIDSVRNHHFAEALGIDIKNRKDMTAVVILDNKHESQHVLSGEYSAKSVRDFIYNFTLKNLKRSLRSHVNDASYTHFFGSNSTTRPDGQGENAVYIKDLTTRSFRKLMKKSGTLTLVGVCGGSCNGRVTLALAEATRLLRACGLGARAARLDARRHDLPWQYTPPRYPALLVFPHHRSGNDEADSVSYPSTVRISGSGLVALALRALPAPSNLRVRLALCHNAKIILEKKTCLRDMREHITTVIGRNLKYWRRTKIRELRDSLFKRLQHLHRVSLYLSLLHVTDLNEHSDKQVLLLNSLDELSNDWHIDVSSVLSKNVTVPAIRAR